MFKDRDITDEDIQLLIDGELTGSKAEQVMAAVLSDTRLFGKFSCYLCQREKLRLWWRTQKLEH